VPTTEQTATSLRALTGGEDAERVVANAVDGLPAGALEAVHTTGDRRLLAATYRLMDNKILTAALSCLDQDVGPPLVRALSLFRDLRTAAAHTRGDPQGAEAVVDLAAGRRFAATQTTTVRIYVDRAEVAVVPFRLELSTTLGHTAVVVRYGAIQAVDCVVSDLAAVLSLAEPAVPVWRGRARLFTLRLPLDPAVVVPLPPVVPGQRSG
jgi:hypothetical protein